MKIDIVPFSEGELAELAEIYVRAYDPKICGENWTRKKAYELLQQLFGQKEKICLVASYEGKTAGALLAHINHWWPGNQLYIDELFVAPEFQKSGIGTALMTVAAEKAQKDFAAAEILLCTFKNKPHPLGWYEKMGFEENCDLVLLGADITKLTWD